MAYETTSVRFTKEKQHFFINAFEVPGIQNASIDYQQPVIQVKGAGLANKFYIPKGPQVGNLSISSFLVTDDIFLPFTGVSPFNCYLVENTNQPQNNFGAESAYLTSYSTRYSIGELPQINVNAVVLGDIGRIPVSGFIDNARRLKMPGPGCLELNLADISTNRITSYDLSFAISRNAIFKIGSTLPVNVIQSPMEATCNFQLEVDKFTANHLKSYPYIKKQQNLSLSIKTYDTSENIVTYNVQNIELLGQSYSATVDGNVAVNLQYKGCL